MSFGRAVLLFVGIAGMAVCVASDAEEGRPCVRSSDAFHPLTVGDSAEITTGRIRGSDCEGPYADAFTWETRDTSVVTVQPTGWVVAHTPGPFRVTAREDARRLVADGFVLPAEWTMRIVPDSARVAVGDTVQFEVYAVDAEGRRLRGIPYSLYTTEFDRRLASRAESAAAPEPPVDRWSHQQVVGPVRFIGTRAGRTVLRARIGPRELTATLEVVPADLAGIVPAASVTDSDGRVARTGRP